MASEVSDQDGWAEDEINNDMYGSVIDRLKELQSEVASNVQAESVNKVVRKLQRETSPPAPDSKKRSTKQATAVEVVRQTDTSLEHETRFTGKSIEQVMTVNLDGSSDATSSLSTTVRQLQRELARLQERQLTQHSLLFKKLEDVNGKMSEVMSRMDRIELVSNNLMSSKAEPSPPPPPMKIEELSDLAFRKVKPEPAYSPKGLQSSGSTKTVTMSTAGAEFIGSSSSSCHAVNGADLLNQVRQLSSEITSSEKAADPSFVATARARLLQVQQLAKSAKNMSSPSARSGPYSVALGIIDTVRTMLYSEGNVQQSSAQRRPVFTSNPTRSRDENT